MIDINSPDFITEFQIEKATVGLVGHGYIGKAVDHFFNRHCRVLVYDKNKPELQTLEQVVRESEIIFIAVPTPMTPDGHFYTGIVEGVISEIREEALRQNRNLDEFIVIVKSTVYPGFTKEMQVKYFGMRIVFSPEFLTERNSIADFLHANRIIVGGHEDDSLVVCKYFQAVQPKRVEDDRLLLMGCDATVAELVKLFTNGISATKIMFANEMYQLCQRMGVKYDEVRMLVSLDQRIGSDHLNVPGHDGQIGYGGHCFPKDLHALRRFFKDMEVPEKVITAVVERNEELRLEKDWLKMEGRAVINV